MKIFIKDYNIFILNQDKIKLLDKYLVNTKIHNEIYSKDGIYYVDNNNTYKLLHNDKNIKIFEKYYNNLDIIVDYSDTVKIKEYQIPFDSMVIPVKNMYYSLTSNSKIKLLIQLNNDSDDILLDLYFIIDEEVDVNSIFIKQELNVFLSLLN